MTQKKCRVCEEVKPLDSFRQRKDNGSYRSECKSCERNRGYIKKEYVITEEQKCSKCLEVKPIISFRKHTDTLRPLKTCRVCEKASNTLWKKENPLNETQLERKRARDRERSPTISMLNAARRRAEIKGLPFNIEEKDIQIPNICPVLKLPLSKGVGTLQDSSPSLDRKIPALGYVKGNVQVISMKANRIKSNGNSLEIRAVLSYVEKIEEENI